MSSSRTAYQSYLLRLWCETEKGDWRASLENVISHECHNFPDMLSLYAFLNKQTTSPIPGVDPKNLVGDQPTKQRLQNKK
jgi:hypothetical protein